ncbi:hypothetical protein J6590_100959 [Homalodisca vitripennis]|nr:hypothetical protein J6590_100959 [Homalodisca vitripennis]
MPAPHPQTPRTDPPRPTVHGVPPTPGLMAKGISDWYFLNLRSSPKLSNFSDVRSRCKSKDVI